MYEVATHEISSTVAPRLPIIDESATLTMLVSRISSTTASITPMIISQARASRPSRVPARRAGYVSAYVDTHVHREADRQVLGRAAVDRVERDAHGHALHDL